MHVEVDQSGKIGNTKVPTVLAFSNAENHAILIPAAVKRACVRRLRAAGKSGPVFYTQLFAVALYLLLKEHIARIELISVDVEYPGRNAEIKLYLLNLLHRAGLNVPAARIAFQYIGKKSGAHKRAKAVFTGKSRPDRVISLEEMLKEF